MLKLGVWRKDLFFARKPEGLLPRIYYLLSKTRVSLHLLRLPPQPDASDISLFERLMPYVQISSGIYRTTNRERFSNLDPVVNAILAERFSRSSPLWVEDWAASDCLTSRQWAKALFSEFPEARFVASDLLLYLVEARKPGSEERFVFEPGGAPLQYIRPPFVIRLRQPEVWLLPINRLLYEYAMRRWQALKERWALPPEWLNSLQDEPIKQNGYELRKLPLVHPEVLQLAREDRRFAIRRQSVFDATTKECHVIRTMNILNREYFPDQQLACGIRNALDALVEGGIWIVGRTASEDPPTHEVTIFSKQSSGELKVLERLGPGSEIESLALETCAAKR